MASARPRGANGRAPAGHGAARTHCAISGSSASPPRAATVARRATAQARRAGHIRHGVQGQQLRGAWHGRARRRPHTEYPSPPPPPPPPPEGFPNAPPTPGTDAAGAQTAVGSRWEVAIIALAAGLALLACLIGCGCLQFYTKAAENRRVHPRTAEQASAKAKAEAKAKRDAEAFKAAAPKVHALPQLARAWEGIDGRSAVSVGAASASAVSDDLVVDDVLCARGRITTSGPRRPQGGDADVERRRPPACRRCLCRPPRRAQLFSLEVGTSSMPRSMRRPPPVAVARPQPAPWIGSSPSG